MSDLDFPVLGAVGLGGVLTRKKQSGNMTDLQVIGVDPAPSKAATVCDGSSIWSCWPSDLAAYLATRSREGSTLICWDAPLTGPPEVDRAAPAPRNHLSAAKSARSRWYSQRVIEGFLRQLRPGIPDGISVQPYCGCPHWAVSRAVLGLPRVGPYDAVPPWRLASQHMESPIEGAWVVEVHPAVAIWLWLRHDEPTIANWQYKSKKKDTTEPPSFDDIRHRLSDKIERLGARNIALKVAAAKDDDALDAAVAYALGWLWLNVEGSVMLLGDDRTGAMLLPRCEAMREEFQKYAKQQLASPPYAPTS